MNQSFDAPWSGLSKLITASIVTLLIVVTIYTPLVGGPIALVVLLFGLLLWIRGYRVDNGRVTIQSQLWKKTFDLSRLTRVKVIPYGTGSSIRIMGSGGFFGNIGLYRSQVLGDYTAYMTDPANAVLLEFNDSRVVVSPHDPVRFATLVEDEYSRIHR